jgi:hypothetical protein
MSVTPQQVTQVLDANFDVESLICNTNFDQVAERFTELAKEYRGRCVRIDSDYDDCRTIYRLIEIRNETPEEQASRLQFEEANRMSIVDREKVLLKQLQQKYPDVKP